MKNSSRPFKERRVYLFPCAVCKREKAQSYKRRLARALVCRKCRTVPKVNENQTSLPLFNEITQPV